MAPARLLPLLLAAHGCFAPTGTPATTDDATTSTGTSTSGSSTSAAATADDPTTTGTTGDVDCALGRPWLGPDAALELIRDDLLDLAVVPMEARAFTRYFSLVQLYNAGLCEDALELHRQAISKLVNSLSIETDVIAPAAIDDERLLLRIDIRDYGWVGEFAARDPVGGGVLASYPNAWELLADSDPYAFKFLGATADDIIGLTGSERFVIAGHAFVGAAARSPLYHDMLRLPQNRAELEKMFGIDLTAAIADELEQDDGGVARAAVHESDLAHHHRLLERHAFPDLSDRAYWLVYDVESNAGAANFFAFPIAVAVDGFQVLFSLPNGLHAYMSTDGEGQRVDAVSLTLLVDLNAEDGAVRPGASCIGCHATGVIPRDDDLRWQLDQGIGEEKFSPDELEQIRALYPPREEFAALVAQDIARFTNSLSLAGLAPDGAEPVAAALADFDADLAARRAAAELWVPEQALLSNLGQLPPDLSDLGNGETVGREVFAAVFAHSVCTLDIGVTDACPDG